MKKTTVSITFDDEKLSAAKLYMEQKGLSFETEMEKAADALYGKYVPANVREFLEMSAGAKTVPKPKSRSSLLPLLWALPLQRKVILIEKSELRN